MKKIFYYIPIVAVLMLVASATLCSCGGDALQKAVKEAFVKGDTTAERYQQICEIITSAPERYSEYVDEGGNINADALDKMINEVGQSLRPPMTWNTKGYGANSTLSLTVYFERSGSMVPYDQTGGLGQLKKAVNDVINFFPYHDNTTIKIVNDNIYPYEGTVDSFLRDRDIYATTKGIGNPAYTDFKLIFDKIFAAQKPGNVSVLVTDLIYSPKDTKGLSVAKIFNEENSLATSIFVKYKGKSIIVNQLSGDFDGLYYPYNGEPFQYRGRRPFYMIVIADVAVMDRMIADAKYGNFLHVSGIENSYRFNQEQGKIDYDFVLGAADDAGRYRPSRDEKHLITNCEGDRETGILSFSIAANLNALNKDNSYLTDVNNYNIASTNGFTMKVRPVDPAEINNNNREYLEGKTHVITFTGKMTAPKDEIKLTLRNDFPTWISQATSNDDSNGGIATFGTTTFGLERFLRGIYDAFSSTQGAYATIDIKLEK